MRGYEGEHIMPDDWRCVEWSANGGMARTEKGRDNAGKERIWFSPHCVDVEADDGVFMLRG